MTANWLKHKLSHGEQMAPTSGCISAGSRPCTAQTQGPTPLTLNSNIIRTSLSFHYRGVKRSWQERRLEAQSMSVNLLITASPRNELCLYGSCIPNTRFHGAKPHMRQRPKQNANINNSAKNWPILMPIIPILSRICSVYSNADLENQFLSSCPNLSVWSLRFRVIYQCFYL